MEDYPEELSEKKSEEYEFKAFDDSNEYNEDYRNAVKHTEKHGGVVYTRVDGEDNQTYYLKGFHLVNRFGYCVLKKLIIQKKGNKIDIDEIMNNITKDSSLVIIREALEQYNKRKYEYD